MSVMLPTRPSPHPSQPQLPARLPLSLSETSVEVARKMLFPMTTYPGPCLNLKPSQHALAWATSMEVAGKLLGINPVGPIEAVQKLPASTSIIPHLTACPTPPFRPLKFQ